VQAFSRRRGYLQASLRHKDGEGVIVAAEALVADRVARWVAETQRQSPRRGTSCRRASIPKLGALAIRC